MVDVGNVAVSAKILLVEDDGVIASGLTYALETEGYRVALANSSQAAIRLAAGGFDLAVVDIGLPDGLGFDAVPQLRSHGTSVLFLTAIDEECHVIRAFEGCADDYATKPFRLGELKARIKAILNRRAGRSGNMRMGSVVINIGEGRAYCSGAPVELTALEYRLLLVFASNKGQVLSRGQILASIWDSESVFVEDNTLTVYVKRLREKLDGAAKIETVRGVGYRADDC